jgi:hypothetical protein
MHHSAEFLDGLRQELPRWQIEGIVTPDAARALAVRYDLDGGPASDMPRDRTGPLAAAAGIAVALALAAALLLSGLADGVLLPLTALAAAFVTTPLAVRGHALAPAARALRVEGRVLFYLAAYALSFVGVAEATRFRSGLASEGLVSALPPLIAAVAALAAGLRRTDVDAHARGEAMLLVATVVAFAAGLSLDTGAGTATVAAMSLAFLSVGRMVRGLSWHARKPFFEGVAVAVLLAASHAFGVFPSLWIAVAAAAACIAAAAVAVYAFERRSARPPLEPLTGARAADT